MATSSAPIDTKILANGNTNCAKANNKRFSWEHKCLPIFRLRASRSCICRRRSAFCQLNLPRLQHICNRRLLRRRAARVKALDEMDFERRLWRAYVFADSAEWPSSDLKLVAKLRRLADQWSCPQSVKAKITLDWVMNWRRKFSIGKEANAEGENESSAAETNATVVDQKVEAAVKEEAVEETQADATLEQILSGYQEDEVYMCFCFEFCWSSLPDRLLGVRRGDADSLESGASGTEGGASGTEGGAVENSVFMLMAANRSGRHRTRLCVVGKEWRPACLRHVNMLSQPVVYAGGGDGHITSDLFAWWFYHEFSPGALTINRKVALLAEAKSFLPCHEFVSSDARAQLLLVPSVAQAQSENAEPVADALNIIETELRVRYAKMLLTSVFFEDVSAHSYVARFTLREAFPLLHKAWLTIRIESFARHYKMVMAGAVDSAPAECFNEPDDGRLLLELQWMSRDLGLKITDDDLLKWARYGFVSGSVADSAAVPGCLKVEPTDGEEETPTASDAVAHLNKALAWMETEPLDPNYLLFMGEIILMAKQVG